MNLSIGSARSGKSNTPGVHGCSMTWRWVFPLEECDHMPFRNRFDLGIRKSRKIGGLGGLYASRKLAVMLF